MESLYRKYRPQTFADVVGQQHVVSTLQHAVLEGRISHAYLFCGPRGTGKTTMARLLAKALLCEQGFGQLPDGTCHQCELIASGEHPDVYELDAASRTGVDNVREEIINRVGYAPVQGSFKVYIIDEVHMLTTAAFNALLKTLEEPPGHVVFVLCTTDPQKIPPTILSRVQRFDFRPISSQDIHDRLTYVCEQEGFTYEDGAIDLIVRHARGGMRDALSTLEQLSVFGGGIIGLDVARDMLGAVPGATLDHVMRSMAACDVAALFGQVGELVNSGTDLLQFAHELAARVRDVYVVSMTGASPAAMPPDADLPALQEEAQAFASSERLSRILTLLGDASREMGTATNQRLVLEIAFTRIARPEGDLTLEALAERIGVLESRLAEGVQITAGRGAAPSHQANKSVQPAQQTNSARQASSQQSQPAQQPQPAHMAQPAQPAQPDQSAGAAQTAEAFRPVQPMQPVQPAQQPQSAQQDQPAQQPRPAQPAQPVQPVQQPQPTQPAQHSQPAQPAQPAQLTQQPQAAWPAQQSQQPQQTQPAEPTRTEHQRQQTQQRPAPAASRPVRDRGDLQRTWREAVSELTRRIPSRGSLLSNAMALDDNGSTLTVGLPKGSSFALKMLDRPDVKQAVEGVISEKFGPREIKYQEGFGSDQEMPRRRKRPPMTAPASTPAPQPQPAPAPASEPAPQPASQSQPAPAPATQSQPAPAPAQAPAPEAPASAPAPAPVPRSEQPAPTPQPQPDPAPAYDLPWDSPQPQASSRTRQEPYYEEVPYDEIGMAYATGASSDAYEPTFSAPAPASQPVRAPQPASAQAPHPASAQNPQPAQAQSAQPEAKPQTAPAPQPEPAPTQASAPNPESQPAPKPESEPTPKPEPASFPATPAPIPEPDSNPTTAAAPHDVPDDLPTDLVAVLENAFEIFGNDVKLKQPK